MYTKDELRKLFSAMRKKEYIGSYQTLDINTPEYTGKGYSWNISYVPPLGCVGKYFQFTLLRWNENIPGLEQPLEVDDSLDAEEFVDMVCRELPEVESDMISNLPETESSTLNLMVGRAVIKMVKVEGGTFTMGSPEDYDIYTRRDESPAHQVTLSDYYIGQYEVTQKLWEAVMGPNPDLHDDDEWVDPELPVEAVSWNEIVNEFLPRLNAMTGKNFTLPTEAQWEFAARGGNKSKGYDFSGSEDLDKVGVCADTDYRTYGAIPVGQKLPNELGIYDMTGNVWEWCRDWYGDYSAEAQINPTGPSTGTERVLRGGGYCEGYMRCTVSSRDARNPFSPESCCGFRLALAL